MSFNYKAEKKNNKPKMSKEKFMKRTVSLVVILTLALSVAAYAQMGMGRCWSNYAQVTSSAQAEDIVRGIISSQNGFSVTGSSAIQQRGGTGYKVAVRNVAGGTEYYVVTPCGYTRGPLTSEVADNFCNNNFGCNMKHGAMGYGHGYGHGMRHGNYMGYDCNMAGNAQATVTTVAQAEEIVKNAVANLEGYSITSTEEVQVNMGTAYKVNVKDAAGNQLYYFVSPFGMVRGPLINTAQGY